MCVSSHALSSLSGGSSSAIKMGGVTRAFFFFFSMYAEEIDFRFSKSWLGGVATGFSVKADSNGYRRC